MNALTRLLAAGLSSALAAIALGAQARPTAIDQLARLQAELRRAHENGDSAAYLSAAQTMYSFLNASPRGTLQLMSARAFAGHPTEALDSFAQFVAMGQADEEVLKAKSFDPLRGLPRYQSIHADMAANTAAKSVAEEVFRLPGSAQIPEDIDYDPKTKHFYLSTVLSKQIVQVDRAGRTKLFADAWDQWPVLALKVDPSRRVLWATEVALDGYAIAAKQDWGRSAVLLYDLASGKLLHRVEGPPKAALGDMALTADGDAIVSDGERGGVYRVNRNTLGVERIDAGDFVSPQTPAVLADGKHILVPDYVRGLGMLDLRTRQVEWIRQGRYALNGIDGLYVRGNILMATQNGTSPERVVEFTLDGADTAIVAQNIIERGTTTLGDPTHGVIVGKYFYYIANSGWDVLDEHGNLLQGKRLPRSSVMRAKIT